MALLDILKMIDASEGIPIDDPANKQLLITRVNEAARELYEMEDFPEAKQEEIFDLNQDSQMVALPWYVEYVRGWRQYNSRLSGLVDAKDNRYNEGMGNETWYQKWRSKGHYPIMREIANESTLTLTIPQAEEAEFSVNIIGATSLSSRIQEKVTFAVGETTKETVNPYIWPIQNIIKSAPTMYDLVVTDADDLVLSLIPNHKEYVFYHWIQIFDWDYLYLSGLSSQVEILYKKAFDNLVNDFDEFLFGNKYDKAIYWKYLSHQSKNPEATVGFESKCQEVLDRISASESVGLRRVINFRKNPYSKLPYGQQFGPNRRK